MDVFTPEKRSEVMSRIRGRDTKPELALRKMLHGLGYRFTVNGPKNRTLPGRPDIVMPKHSTVLFVHGCFWHAHEHCPYFRLPSTRRDGWAAKKSLAGSAATDAVGVESSISHPGAKNVIITISYDAVWIDGDRHDIFLDGNGILELPLTI